MLYLELFCKYNTLIRIIDYSAKKKSMLFVRHCENCERRGGSRCCRRLCRQSVTAKHASLTPSDRTPTMGAG